MLCVPIFACGNKSPNNYLVQIFHAGTPDSTKSLILKNILHDGIIRILISTIAFGMRVNCKGVYRVIHFGSSLNFESYLQECGMVGVRSYSVNVRTVTSKFLRPEALCQKCKLTRVTGRLLSVGFKFKDFKQ